MSTEFPRMAGCLMWLGTVAAALIAIFLIAIPAKLLGASEFVAGLLGGHAGAAVWFTYFTITDKSEAAA